MAFLCLSLSTLSHTLMFVSLFLWGLYVLLLPSIFYCFVQPNPNSYPKLNRSMTNPNLKLTSIHTFPLSVLCCIIIKVVRTDQNVLTTLYLQKHTHIPTFRMALRHQTKHWNCSAATNPRPRGVGLWSRYVVAGSRGAHADRTQNRILFYVFLWPGEGDVILITSVDSFGHKA